MTWPPSCCWFWFRSVTGAEDCKNNWTPGEPPTSETVETKPRYISSGSRYDLSRKHYFLGRDTSPREVSFVAVEETISGLGSNTSGFSRFSYHHNKAQCYAIATGPKGQRPVLQSPESTPGVNAHGSSSIPGSSRSNVKGSAFQRPSVGQCCKFNGPMFSSTNDQNKKTLHLSYKTFIPTELC